MAAFIVDESKLDVRFAYYLLTAFRMSDLVAVGALPSLNGKCVLGRDGPGRALGVLR